jgi:1,4-dihydroxy-2-naphthoate octaprenyltransferase
MIFPFVWIAVLSMIGMLPYTTVFIFLTLPIAVACSKTMVNSVEGGVHLIGDIDVRTANLQLLFSLMLTVGLIAGKFIA